ncbi:MAG: pentapeptide repeat-containing protein [Alphaproteobacteria bacterium]|nr:pentapeptide repeat-containing protein [Alphaproteobacteria bacterium]
MRRAFPVTPAASAVLALLLGAGLPFGHAAFAQTALDGFRDNGQCPRCDLRLAEMRGIAIEGKSIKSHPARGRPEGDLAGRTDLSGADLRRAEVERADLSRANMTGASMRGVDLERRSSPARSSTTPTCAMRIWPDRT